MASSITLSSFASLACGLLSALAGCQAPRAESNNAPATDPKAAAAVAAPQRAPEPGVGPMPRAWVDARVEDAAKRLTATEPGKLVWRAIEAHGGLAQWLDHGTLEFEFDYAPIGKPEQRRHTFQRMDLWRAHGRHEELGEHADAEFGFDGEKAWIMPGPDAFPSTARFWTTTPYYFLGMPFVLGDPGTRFEALPDADLDGAPHHLVKVTYAAGTGDSPDDYYILYLDADAGTLSALRYVVAYPGFFEPGQHSPEKLMVYSDYQTVGGLRMAHALDTYAWNADEQARGDKVTDVKVSRLRFGLRYPDDLFAPPEGAHVEPPLAHR